MLFRSGMNPYILHFHISTPQKGKDFFLEGNGCIIAAHEKTHSDTSPLFSPVRRFQQCFPCAAPPLHAEVRSLRRPYPPAPSGPEQRRYRFGQSRQQKAARGRPCVMDAAGAFPQTAGPPNFCHHIPGRFPPLLRRFGHSGQGHFKIALLRQSCVKSITPIAILFII